jgi:DNA-binding PadR family transcriptional regulator
MSSDVLQVQQRSLYPAFHRLERWIKGHWDVTGNNRRAKFYRITAAGRKQLDEETRSWRMLVTAVGGHSKPAKGKRPE